MKTGLLWFDNDPKTSLDEKVARAAAHYRQKYGRSATQCYVNPSLLATATDTVVAGIRVKSSKTVLPYHFWLGIEEETK